RPHGLTESEYAAWPLSFPNPICPAMNVVGLQQSVSGDVSSAQAMGPGVRKKHAVTIGEKPSTIAQHAEPVIAYPVEQKYRRAIRFAGTKNPSANNGPVLACNAGVAEINFVFDCVESDQFFIVGRDGAV